MEPVWEDRDVGLEGAKLVFSSALQVCCSNGVTTSKKTHVARIDMQGHACIWLVVAAMASFRFVRSSIILLQELCGISRPYPDFRC